LDVSVVQQAQFPNDSIELNAFLSFQGSNSQKGEIPGDTVNIHVVNPDLELHPAAINNEVPNSNLDLNQEAADPMIVLGLQAVTKQNKIPVDNHLPEDIMNDIEPHQQQHDFLGRSIVSRNLNIHFGYMQQLDTSSRNPVFQSFTVHLGQ
jgi:hypothetical protein